MRQTIVTDSGIVITGELREHRGNGRVGIDVDGKRYVGRKIDRAELGRILDSPRFGQQLVTDALAPQT